MPDFTRRTFLKLTITGATMVALGSFITRHWILEHTPATLTPTEKHKASRIIDILIPADETPGALDLEIDKQLLSQAEHNPQLRSLLRQGCEWLDGQAQQYRAPHFLALATDEQTRLVAAAEYATPKSVPQRFFTRLRDFSMHHYYSDARSWPQLGYQGPPQPLGFPDYQSPPPLEKA